MPKKKIGSASTKEVTIKKEAAGKIVKKAVSRDEIIKNRKETEMLGSIPRSSSQGKIQTAEGWRRAMLKKKPQP